MGEVRQSHSEHSSVRVLPQPRQTPVRAAKVRRCREPRSSALKFRSTSPRSRRKWSPELGDAQPDQGGMCANLTYPRSHSLGSWRACCAAALDLSVDGNLRSIKCSRPGRRTIRKCPYCWKGEPEKDSPPVRQTSSRRAGHAARGCA